MNFRASPGRSIVIRLVPVMVMAVLLFGGFGCKVPSKEAQEAMKPVTLKWWSVFSDYSAAAQLISEYRKMHPHVTIEYKNFAFEDYESAVLNAMAENRGPDILSLHSTWLREWQDRIQPSPASLKIAFKEMQGSIKKEEVVVLKSLPGATPKQVANDFIDTVAEEVVLPVPQTDPRITPTYGVYGLPLSVDTMVMFYNRDLLNAAEIPAPAQYWSDFQKQTPALTKLDPAGEVIQSAAALGTGENVERYADILSLLMMQNGTPMTDSSGSATFDRHAQETAGQPMTPGAVAMVFYNDFANPLKEVYTWNANQPPSLQAFLAGKTAYFFGYSYHLPYIRAQAKGLNLGIAPFPQITGNKPVYFANYWVESVSRQAKDLDISWDFIRFMTSADSAKKYLPKAGRPTALREVVNIQLEEADMSVFASQLPSSRNWYRGKDSQAAERVMLDMIGEMLEPDADPQNILQLGATKINQTL